MNSKYEDEFYGLNPAYIPVTAAKVIREWSSDEYGRRIRFRDVGGDAPNVFLSMLRSIEERPPDQVLALAMGRRIEDIKAIATATFTDTGAWNRSQMDIGELVVKPTADQPGGVAAAFLGKIAEWAGARERSVYISHPIVFEAYYQTLGIAADTAERAGAGTLYPGDPGDSPELQEYFLTTLDTGRYRENMFV